MLKFYKIGQSMKRPLPFEMQARKALAGILVRAIKDTKKRLVEKS